MTERSVMFHDKTGKGGLPCARVGFTDYDTFRFGYIARDTWSGNLDAPDFMPQGSVRVWNTLKHAPGLALAHRDELAGCKRPGWQHDGPEAPTIREGFCE